MNPDLRMIVIGGSRGALPALMRLVADLDRSITHPIFIVTHIGRHESVLPELLRSAGQITASHATHGEAISPGRIYIAPPDWHMVLRDGVIELNRLPRENFARPAIDPLFRSAAFTYGRRVISVTLSGDLDDGAAGHALVKAAGGFTIVQDPNECEAPSMPTAALEAAAANVVCRSSEIAQVVREVTTMTMHETSSSPVPRSLQREIELAGKGVINPALLDSIGERSALTCPECGGALWRLRDQPPLRYRCHTGHAFSALSLEDGYERSSLNALEVALRSVSERWMLAGDRLEQARLLGDDALVAIETARKAEAGHLRLMLEDLLNRPSEEPA